MNIEIEKPIYKTEHILVRVDEHQKLEMALLAREFEVSVADLIRQIMKKFADENRSKIEKYIGVYGSIKL